MFISAYEWLAAAPVFVQVAAGIGLSVASVIAFLWALGLIVSFFEWADRP